MAAPLKPGSIVAYSRPAESPLETRGGQGLQGETSYFANELSSSSNDTNLSPLRAHYLKRELVALQLRREIADLSFPDALSILGPPFSPASGPTGRQSKDLDLPLIRFFFHHFVRGPEIS